MVIDFCDWSLTVFKMTFIHYCVKRNVFPVLALRHCSFVCVTQSLFLHRVCLSGDTPYLCAFRKLNPSISLWRESERRRRSILVYRVKRSRDLPPVGRVNYSAQSFKKVCSHGQIAVPLSFKFSTVPMVIQMQRISILSDDKNSENGCPPILWVCICDH